ncbi:Uncharacterised protein [Klebsiella pneumoniae]|nr:Uncharacterised protein [Klebsiella pneumoniae]
MQVTFNGPIRSPSKACTSAKMRRSIALCPSASTAPTCASRLKAIWRSKRRGSRGRALSSSAVCRASSLTPSRPRLETERQAVRFSCRQSSVARSGASTSHSSAATAQGLDKRNGAACEARRSAFTETMTGGATLGSRAPLRSITEQPAARARSAWARDTSAAAAKKARPTLEKSKLSTSPTRRLLSAKPMRCPADSALASRCRR